MVFVKLSDSSEDSYIIITKDAFFKLFDEISKVIMDHHGSVTFIDTGYDCQPYSRCIVHQSGTNFITRIGEIFSANRFNIKDEVKYVQKHINGVQKSYCVKIPELYENDLYNLVRNARGEIDKIENI